MRINTISDLPEPHRRKLEAEQRMRDRAKVKHFKPLSSDLAHVCKPVGVSTVQIYRLVLPVPPSSNTAYANSAKGRVKTQVALEFVSLVRQIVGGKLEQITTEVDLEIWFYRARRSGDTDNRLKILLDSLKGLAYEDDCKVRDILIRRRECPTDPRLEVEIKPV